MPGAITEVPGVLAGHAHDRARGSGLTVLLFPDGAAGGVDIRGEAAGTRQMDSLLKTHPAGSIHALVFAGGSAFGLDAAAGVVRWLEERGTGFRTPHGIVPIVPAAVIYDLGYKDAAFRPTPGMGYEAAARASSRSPARGSVGAGTGATVGKAFGVARAMKGGLGTACEAGGDERVGALAVVNAFGDITDPETGEIIAGARRPDGAGFVDTEEAFRAGLRRTPFSTENTTLAAVATASVLSRDELGTVARMCHASLCRVVRPVHTPMDGDLVVALSTGRTGRRGNVMQVAALAARALERAVLDGVRSARGTRAIPGLGDRKRKEGAR